MPTPNMKVYLAISGVLIVLFLVVTFIPFGKKSTDDQPQNNFPTPTTIEANPTSGVNNQVPTVAPADFTGVSEQEMPQEAANISLQKQDLRSKVPLDTGLFQIDFDYGEDKFIVTLAEPKAENRQQFGQWLKENYPSLDNNQFNFK